MMQINLREVKESFIATSGDILQKCESILLEMERRVEPRHFDELLRHIHTIKGNAGIFELDALIKLCHAFETRYSTLRDTDQVIDSNTVDLALTALDKMRALVAKIDEPTAIAALDIDSTIQSLERGAVGLDSARKGESASVPEPGFDRLRNRTKKIKLPDKYFDVARRENHYLIFVVVDLADQGGLSVDDFFKSLAAIHKSQELLSLGVLRKDFQASEAQAPFLPYFLILSSRDRADAICARLRIRPVLFHYFLEPEIRSELKPRQAAQEIEARETHLKVHLELLNSLIDITGEIVLTRNALVRKLDTVADAGLAAFAKKLSYLVSDLQDKVMRTRLQALEVLFHKFPRLVRETAQLTGKKAEIRIEGGDIEIDKAIIDEISDPLVHIIRNAVDHGIEKPEVRIALGKSEVGSVLVTAKSREGNIIIGVMDDGAGLDYERIRNTAIAKGLVTREASQAASVHEISEYLFLPGFSTKNEVTTISGRGVGMDVVRTNIMKLGGSVEIVGESGKGSTIEIVIPQTLSILTCLLVELASMRFVIPQQNIVEVVTIDRERLKNIQNKEAYELRSRLLPLVSGSDFLEINDEREATYIVVIRTEKFYFGLKIQRVLEKEEVVVKPIPQFGQDRQIFAGAAILGDGTIAPILDATLIAKAAMLKVNTDKKLSVVEQRKIAVENKRYLLFRVHKRKVAFCIIGQPRIESIEPEKIEQVVDRAVVHYRNEVIPILPLDFLGKGNVSELTNLIIVQQDENRYGILASEILDILSDTLTLRREKSDGGEIEGYAIIEGETVVVVDLEFLMRRARAPLALEPVEVRV